MTTFPALERAAALAGCVDRSPSMSFPPPRRTGQARKCNHEFGEASTTAGPPQAAVSHTNPSGDLRGEGVFEASTSTAVDVEATAGRDPSVEQAASMTARQETANNT